jgi:hypothetical protein
MAARLVFPLVVSFAAALGAELEGTAFAWWSADRAPACSGSSPAEACSLNGFIAFMAGGFFAIETLAAVLVGLVLFRNGKRLGAGIAVAALGCALALEHVWLLT